MHSALKASSRVEYGVARHAVQSMTAAGGILEQSWKAQMEELEVRLARSKAKWKIVIGHHPLKSQLQVTAPSWHSIDSADWRPGLHRPATVLLACPEALCNSEFWRIAAALSSVPHQLTCLEWYVFCHTYQHSVHRALARASRSRQAWR